jgi:putative ABC transport system permease protein
MSEQGTQLAVAANRDIKELSMRVFDRTFLVTQVLRALTGLVAFAGVFGALMAVMIERRREFATLRALGFTPAQVRRSMLWQSGMIGAVAGVLSLPLGILISLALIYAVNVRAFGWTMDLQVSGAALLIAFAIATVAALLAAIYPASRVAGTHVAPSLRAH